MNMNTTTTKSQYILELEQLRENNLVSQACLECLKHLNSLVREEYFVPFKLEYAFI